MKGSRKFPSDRKVGFPAFSKSKKIDWLNIKGEVVYTHHRAYSST